MTEPVRPDAGPHWDSTRSLHAMYAGDIRVCRLVVAHCPEPARVGATLVLEGPTSLGRRSRSGEGEADFLLGDSAVSRLHASVEPDPASPSGWSVRDLGSRNGTILQGRRVGGGALEDGAVVRVGETILLFQVLTLRAGERLVGEAGPLLGTSPAMERVRGQIATLAKEELPVLIVGESGVGKELVAHELHLRSGRSGPYVPVNCGGLPKDLVESELFGHEAGAFTGATRPARGLFAEAEGGTIFLDEIGELPLELQPKLLRVLSTGEVRPVGSSRSRQVSVRVVAATNRDLEERVAAGAFRGDLLARLTGWTLEVPPLRARREDVPAIARRLTTPRLRFSADAAEALLLHSWPYNVRELIQVVSAARVRAASPEIGLVHLPEPLQRPLMSRVVPRLKGDLPGGVTADVPVELAVRRDRVPDASELRRVVARFEGNVSQVADFFGKERAQVYRWLRKWEIDPAEWR